MTTVTTTETAVNETVAPVAVNETVAPVAVNETVAPVAVNETVAPVAEVASHMENLKAKKEAVVSEKVPHASYTLNHNTVKEKFVGNTHAIAATGNSQPHLHGVLSGKLSEFSDNVLKRMGVATDHEMVVIMVPSDRRAEVEQLALECNDSFYSGLDTIIEESGLEKNAKKNEAAAKKVVKDAEKVAKAAQKVIDDADKKAKKDAAALAKTQEAASAPVIGSDTLDVSGLFVGEEVAPVVATQVEADPILAAALASAQVNANVQAYADADVSAQQDTNFAMAAE